MSSAAPSTPASEAAAGQAEQLGYTLWAVFRRNAEKPVGSVDLADAVAQVEASGVAVRGWYDVSGLRADADLMVWLHTEFPAPNATAATPRVGPEVLQSALRTLRRAQPLADLIPGWNAMGVHRDAEFTRNHSPAFMRGLAPAEWITVYPFVRSYEWYLLPDDERRTMLADHGRKGSEYSQVLSNTVASFALGDYEWILALEAPELVDLVDLMRHLRQTEARRHVREEVPFFTGRRIGLDEIAEVLA